MHIHTHIWQYYTAQTHLMISRITFATALIRFSEVSESLLFTFCTASTSVSAISKDVLSNPLALSWVRFILSKLDCRYVYVHRWGREAIALRLMKCYQQWKQDSLIQLVWLTRFAMEAGSLKTAPTDKHTIVQCNIKQLSNCTRRGYRQAYKYLLKHTSSEDTCAHYVRTHACVRT